MIEWILLHYLDVLAALGALTAAATVITKLTPSPKDDEIVGKVRKVLEFVSLRLK